MSMPKTTWAVSLIYALALSMSLLLPQCLLGAPASPYPGLPSPGSNNLWYISNDSDTAVVFVHGLMSSSRTAWLNENGTYWPRLVAKDKIHFGTPSIYLGGYFTRWDSGPYNTRDAANELYRSLSQDRVLQKRRILFVAHSTGGIVVRQLLVRKREELREKAIGLVLIASPSTGSRDATRLQWLSEFANNEMSRQLQWNHPLLEELDREFEDLVYYKVYPCLVGIEGVENHLVISRLFGLWRGSELVEMSSAGRYFGDPQRLPDTDHFSAVKPSGTTHPAHQLLRYFWRTQFQGNCPPDVPPPVLSNIESEVAKLLERAWRDTHLLRVPEGWAITDTEWPELRPPPGSVFDRAGLEVDVIPTCGYGGEWSYFEKLLQVGGEVERGVLSFKDQREALSVDYPELWEGWEVVEEFPLRYKVMGELGEVFDEDIVQVARNRADDELMVLALLRGTSGQDIFEEPVPLSSFRGYDEVRCRARGLTSGQLRDVCKTLLEGTLLYKTLIASNCKPPR